MNVTDTVKFFGLPPLSKEFDKYLTTLDIHERPTFSGTPVQRVVKYDKGYTLSFEGKLGYEEFWGAAREDGDMIFSTIQVYGPLNKNGFAPYAQQLPYGLSFGVTLKQALSIFGEPATNHKSGPRNHVYVWYNHQGITISVCFVPDEQGASFIAFSKAKLYPPQKLA